MAHNTGRTILTPVSKEDPKHGRWILPLVVLGLVLFTWTFVNALPAADTVTTTVVAGEETTTTTAPPEETTTTTLAPEIVAFVASTDALSATATELRTRAQTINDEYPDITGYGATRDLLSALNQDTEALVAQVAAVEVPAAAAEKWTDVTTASSAMAIASANMLDGLVNTSGSEARLAALDDYNIAAATFTQALDSAATAAAGG